MSLDPPNRWINYLVWVAGGRQGLLGAWYVPTLQEEADERYYALERRKVEIEMAREDSDNKHASLQKTIKRLWEQGEQRRARVKAQELYSCELELRRLAAEQRLVANEASAVRAVRDGNAVQESVMFRARALRERFAEVPPQHMQRVLGFMEQMQSFETMTQDMIEDMYRDNDERLLDVSNDRDERDGDSVESVLEELGLVAAVEQAPAVPATPPGALGPGERS
jgi:hypothetical protein